MQNILHFVQALLHVTILRTLPQSLQHWAGTITGANAPRLPPTISHASLGRSTIGAFVL
jgi:hypothetical protein